jgi:hypothetical protein
VTPAERVETGKATAEAMIRGPSRPVRFGSVRVRLPWNQPMTEQTSILF